MQDVHSEQLFKEDLREEIQSTKRVDNIEPNLELNSGVDQEVPQGENFPRNNVFEY